MLKRTIFMIIFVLLSATLAFANTNVDDEGNINDPTVNENANACYDGGTMADRCLTDLDWQAGWYLIRFEYGLIEREVFPQWVVWVLPPEIVPEEIAPTILVPPPPSIPVPSAGCVPHNFSQYMDFSGGYFLPAGTTVYQLNSCTTQTGTSGSARVYAPAGFDALTLCNLNGTFTSVTNYPYDVYDCNP